MLRLTGLLGLALAVAGCSDGTRGSLDAGPDEDAETRDAPMGDTGPDGEDAGDGGRSDTGLPDAGPGNDIVVYAHSRNTLFSFSPRTERVTEIGVFTMPDGTEAPFMLDLAVDSEGNVFTSSDSALWQVDPETADVEKVGDFDLGGDQLFALSFLHEGVLDPDSETLIGATNEGFYHRVDTDTAETELLDRYPDDWRSSGDIVSVRDLGTYATVRRDDRSSDVLVQMEFASDGSSSVTVKGPIVEGDRELTQLFGLGFWGRALYGFSNAGELIAIDRDTGAATLVSEDTGTDQFWGAGVTTRAPVLY